VTADRIGMRGEIEAWAREHDLPYFDESVRYAKEREAFGHPIADFQGLQWRLADMATRIEAARLLIIRIDAKRQALDALDAQRGCVLPALGGSRHGGNGDGAEIRAVVELPESVTSQFAFAGLAALR